MAKSKPTVQLNFGNGGLFLIFLVLKLTETVDWSWWIITLPLWLPFAIVFGIMGAIALFGAIGVVIGALMGVFK